MILVTGAGGTTGSEVVKALSRQGAGFRACFHTQEKAAKAAAAGFDAVVADFRKPETLRPALQGATKLFLLSPVSPDLASLEATATAAAKEAGVERVVKLSVWRASEQGYLFAAWHRQAEKEIESSGIPFTFLRPNSFMQNFVNYFAAGIRDRQSILIPAGAARVSTIDVRDIAEVAVKVLTDPGHEGRAYDLSGPESLSYAQIAAIFSMVLGKRITYVDVPEADAGRAMIEHGTPEWMAEGFLDLQRYSRQGLAADVLGSVQQILSRKATSFERFARDHARAFL
jgi:uncharacterized protein YbjT (DUF2867 family)